MTFQIGDRVVLKEPYGEFIGNIGTVVRIDEGPMFKPPNVIYINWDRRLSYGHDCFGCAFDGHGWNFFGKDLLRVSNMEDDVEICPVD